MSRIPPPRTTVTHFKLSSYQGGPHERPCDKASRVRAFVINGLRDGPLPVECIVEQAFKRHRFIRADVFRAGAFLGVAEHHLAGDIYWTRPEKVIPIWWSKRWFDVKGDRPAVLGTGGSAA